MISFATMMAADPNGGVGSSDPALATGAAHTAAHTPGPWEVADGRRVGVTLPCRLEECGFDSHCVALTYGHDPRINAEANARLIAAAPDMLAALCMLSDALPSDKYMRERGSVPGQGILMMRAAIAKATGGAA